MFKKYFLLLLLLSAQLFAGQKTQWDSDGIVPPRKTTAQIAALTGVVTGQLVNNTTTNKLQRYNGVAWVDVGSGVGGINDISPNNDAEGGTTNWAVFADAASATGPADGTGGSASVTWTTSSSSPLRDLSSFVLTKDASNRQGQGVSYSFTVPTADFAKVHTIGFTYNTSANYANQDVQVWIYDVTNSTLIQPSNYKLDGAPSTGPPGKYQATFQTSATGTSYRLILYVAGTTATAWTVKADDFTVGPQSLVYASPVTDWTSFTSTTSLTGGTTSHTGYWRRVGDTMEVKIDAVFTSVFTGGSALFTIPSGYTIDTSKLSSSPVAGVTPWLGTVRYNDIGTDNYNGDIYYSSTTVVHARLIVDDAGAASAYTASANSISTTTPMTWANNDRMSLDFKVPILGWGSSLQTSDTADGRVVAAKYHTAQSQTIVSGAETVVDYEVKDYDTHNSVTTGSGWKFTAPLSGYYRLAANWYWNSPASISSQFLRVWVGGAAKETLVRYANANDVLSGGTTVYLDAGNYVQVEVYHNAGADRAGYSSGLHSISIERTSGPSAIAAAETIVANYSTAAAQNLSSGSSQIIDFGTKSRDSHGAVTTGASWKFTSPSAGSYIVSSTITFASVAWAAGNYVEIDVFKNGSVYRGALTRVDSSTADYTSATVTTQIDLLAGEYIDVRGYQNSAGARALFADAHYNHISIWRQGN